jgi:hypothetical protein
VLMSNAAIYARVSSARQKEQQTISSQTAALQSHAEDLGLDVPALMPLTEIPQSCSAKFLTLGSCQSSGSVGVHGVSPFVE